MSQEPDISEASEADQGAVIALWVACGLTRPWNEPAADFRMAQGGATSAVLVARSDEGVIVGSVMVGSDGHRGWVYYLAVAPDAQRKGLGRALMTAAEDWLAARDVPKIQLMVRNGNPAEEFYRRLGYETQEVSTLGRWLKA